MAITDYTVYFKDLTFYVTIFMAIIVLAILYFLFKIGMLYFKSLKEKPKKTKLSKAEKELEKLKLKMEKQKIIKASHKAELVVKDTKVKVYSPLKKASKFSLKFWKEWFLDKYFPDTLVLINMELTNGFHRTFIVREKDEGFVFKRKKYLFDDDNKYYNIDAKLYTFDYHEGIALPIKRKIPVTSIKKSIESSGMTDIEYAINPSTLQRFMTAKIAEGVMKGTQLDEFLRKLQMFIIVIMVAVLVHLALFLYASGILQNIKLPF